jgi:hypothetical protein
MLPVGMSRIMNASRSVIQAMQLHVENQSHLERIHVIVCPLRDHAVVIEFFMYVFVHACRKRGIINLCPKEYPAIVSVSTHPPDV